MKTEELTFSKKYRLSSRISEILTLLVQWPAKVIIGKIVNIWVTTDGTDY